MPRKKTALKSPRSKSAALKSRSPKSRATSTISTKTQLEAVLTKLLKRAVSDARTIRKLAKMLGADVPKIVIRVKR